MIRQEILVEKMKAEIDDTKQRVVDTLVDLKTERNKFAVDIDRIENENRIKMEGISTEMERIIGSAITPSVAFKAHKISDKKLADKKLMIFEDTIFTIGNAYNNQTGIFVAPVGGIYHFSAQICVASDDWMYFGILLGEKLISSSANGDKFGGCFTFDAIAAVEAGQCVSVQCTNSCSGDSLWESGHAVAWADEDIMSPHNSLLAAKLQMSPVVAGLEITLSPFKQPGKGEVDEEDPVCGTV
ncbi:uncharacterized protein LOC128553712 [Mercenaria mercenaria]|uniref:uncharacterized protein LOC128553712 n=1 Tax=Mercenaria mercenaria TaxID=6596 RepID=UPI00234E9E82|nr:uncharacterized protein LOC128553712 [Mercenaria mercenaria]